MCIVRRTSEAACCSYSWGWDMVICFSDDCKTLENGFSQLVKADVVKIPLGFLGTGQNPYGQRVFELDLSVSNL